MSNHTKLIREIEDYVRRRGIAETTFGRMAAGDTYFVSRLRKGGSLLVRTEERVRDFMKRPLPTRPKRAKEPANV
ncbi:hypothetical protein [Gluconobacter oxydans]|uniref:hypothetical protein n=1 Tax=Gluconobacter oxydans TaxID=442 RepID=UPI0012DA56E1|nr:hypothetical protein [Gluconobacter oxydans]